MATRRRSLPILWLALTAGECTTAVEPESPAWRMHVEGLVVDQGVPAVGVTVEVWAIPQWQLHWERNGMYSVTDQHGVYRFDVTDGSACAREPVDVEPNWGWVVGPRGGSGGFPRLYVKPLIAPELCGQPSIQEVGS